MAFPFATRDSVNFTRWPIRWTTVRFDYSARLNRRASGNIPAKTNAWRNQSCLGIEGTVYMVSAMEVENHI